MSTTNCSSGSPGRTNGTADLPYQGVSRFRSNMGGCALHGQRVVGRPGRCSGRFVSGAEHAQIEEPQTGEMPMRGRMRTVAVVLTMATSVLVESCAKRGSGPARPVTTLV